MIKLFLKLTNTKGGGENLPQISSWFHSILTGYNHKKYWRRRAVVIDPNNKTSIIKKILYLIYIKRVDAKHHCSFGTSLHYGAQFQTPPHFPHGPNGIIVGGDAIIGKNCVLYHQVTIPGGNVIVGDNVTFYPGAKVIRNITIGSNVRIGANAVVSEDIPDNSTVFPQKSVIIQK